MKHEILKKTILYRTMAFILGMGITTIFLFNKPALSIWLTIISELASVGLYYMYEYFWRKLTRLKKDASVFLISRDKGSWYNVVEVLDENKFIIEVV